jgi:hypothetical protein|tara:strand:- start:266 stop:547 length:282 start_codon:yes stop_codon:yes gene_type:complete
MVSLHIEIGCPPGGIRPQSHLTNLITNLQSSKNNNIAEWATRCIKNQPDCSTCFGDMSCFLEIESDIKDEVQSFFKTKLTELYYSGAIRYASW